MSLSKSHHHQILKGKLLKLLQLLKRTFSNELHCLMGNHVIMPEILCI